LKFFEISMKIAHESREDVYEINVLVNMALIYERMIEYDKAIECLEKALKIDPEN
jgi:tetratricopeptide (TPR) repeat protein